MKQLLGFKDDHTERLGLRRNMDDGKRRNLGRSSPDHMTIENQSLPRPKSAAVRELQ